MLRLNQISDPFSVKYQVQKSMLLKGNFISDIYFIFSKANRATPTSITSSSSSSFDREHERPGKEKERQREHPTKPETDRLGRCVGQAKVRKIDKVRVGSRCTRASWLNLCLTPRSVSDKMKPSLSKRWIIPWLLSASSSGMIERRERRSPRPNPFAVTNI